MRIHSEADEEFYLNPSILPAHFRILPRHTARILGGQNTKKKNVLSILEKIHPREKQRSKEHFFFLGLPSEARRWRGFRSLRIFDKIGSSAVVNILKDLTFSLVSYNLKIVTLKTK